MNKSLMLTLAASAAAIVAVPAQAADFMLSGVSNGGGEVTYQIDRVTTARGTTDRFFFNAPTSGGVTISITNTGFGTANVDFLSATLNGSATDLIVQNTGPFSAVYTLSQIPVLAGLNVFTVAYTAGSRTATFNGNIAFGPLAVPEPATWAMLMLGVGLIGAAFRARKSQPSYKMAVSYS